MFLRNETAGANSQTVSSSIIFQLAGYNPTIKARIAEKLKSDPSLASADIGQQFPRLLVDTMNVGVGKGDTTLAMVGPTLIVIDGIHEISDRREQNRILTAIADYLGQLPSNFRILMTSQDGDMVTEIFGRIAHRCHVRKITFDNPIGETPSGYLSWCLNQLVDEMPVLFEHYSIEDLHGQLTERSMGIHLWIDTLYRFLQFCHNRGENRESTVLQELVSSKAPHSKEDAMDDLYRVLCSYLPYPNHFFKDLLFAFIHSSRALSFSYAHQSIALACIFDTSPSDCGIFGMMKQLGLVVERGRDEGGTPLFILHPSFEDFVVNERRAYGTEFYVARGASKQVLEIAATRMNVLNNLLELKLSEPNFVINQEKKDVFLPIPDNLYYASCTWAYCLDLCGTDSIMFSPQYLVLLGTLGNFVSFHLLQWMEYMGIMDLDSHTASLLQRVFTWSKVVHYIFYVCIDILLTM